MKLVAEVEAPEQVRVAGELQVAEVLFFPSELSVGFGPDLEQCLSLAGDAGDLGLDAAFSVESPYDKDRMERLIRQIPESFAVKTRDLGLAKLLCSQNRRVHFSAPLSLGNREGICFVLENTGSNLKRISLNPELSPLLLKDMLEGIRDCEFELPFLAGADVYLSTRTAGSGQTGRFLLETGDGFRVRLTRGDFGSLARSAEEFFPLPRMDGYLSAGINVFRVDLRNRNDRELEMIKKLFADWDSKGFADSWPEKLLTVTRSEEYPGFRSNVKGVILAEILDFDDSRMLLRARADLCEGQSARYFDSMNRERDFPLIGLQTPSGAPCPRISALQLFTAPRRRGCARGICLLEKE